jgi:hypothetical protein
MGVVEPSISAGKAGWRLREWCDATGLSRAYVNILISRRSIRSVKSGKARIIMTSPSEYLNSLDEVAD